MTNQVLETYECSILKPHPVNTIYYPADITWKYVLSSKPSGCFGSTKKYVAVPESYSYPYYYYYVYYRPYTLGNITLSIKNADKSKKKVNESNDQEKKEESNDENGTKTSKKNDECNDRENNTKKYVSVLTPPYYIGSLFYPTAIFYP
ncbi:conserved Plasmodium protein, unknown function [Plasmodium berghei]|uniref:Sporozoite surface protein essential for liver stage development n=2 Tax=Plasmodium berghei TaxID=5821 RepID=A0A509AJW2_PLABA|nr:sporozoite surface protein essential for liver stage development [Plasmodium berghei ANKA]CXI41172.1 conserved Plasmodium protein, unknown function [Plasmodium berghei]SCM21889.1 conserved Plasmodium protein, unknown function [Plasmodium berghei]SCN25134.1 conserved Plasmodium protein, unknown function [Plasmodium berghei]SCO60144.1 conserved Plasmodium protein, unknown function [Plasmodium berghei]SCO61713.1 conserved Plasmodium protein, unknown function [Plasmodium berghei]|eukprot:XP_034421460.1 sporozoite surface protein essential for liver stage development [Plasmodium berghei ANKA]